MQKSDLTSLLSRKDGVQYFKSHHANVWNTTLQDMKTYHQNGTRKWTPKSTAINLCFDTKLIVYCPVEKARFRVQRLMVKHGPPSLSGPANWGLYYLSAPEQNSVNKSHACWPCGPVIVPPRGNLVTDQISTQLCHPTDKLVHVPRCCYPNTGVFEGTWSQITYLHNYAILQINWYMCHGAATLTQGSLRELGHRSDIYTTMPSSR